jgi:hypothetical protein
MVPAEIIPVTELTDTELDAVSGGLLNTQSQSRATTQSQYHTTTQRWGADWRGCRRPRGGCGSPTGSRSGKRRLITDLPAHCSPWRSVRVSRIHVHCIPPEVFLVRPEECFEIREDRNGREASSCCTTMQSNIKTKWSALSCACGQRMEGLSNAQRSRWGTKGQAEWKLPARRSDK